MEFFPIIFFLIVGLMSISFAAYYKKQLVEIKKKPNSFKTEKEKNRRIRMGAMWGLVGVISIGIAGYWFFVNLI